MARKPRAGWHPPTGSNPDWAPDRNAVHRLIQFLDVLAIAFNRFRQLSFRLPEPSPPGDAVDRFIAERGQLWADFAVVKRELFPASDIAPQYTAAALGDLAVAELVCSGSSDETIVRQATQWLTAVGWNLTPRVYPRDPGSPAHDQFDREGEVLSQYGPVRQNLISALARIGQTVPQEIVRRQHLAFCSLSSKGEEPVPNEVLLGWVSEAQPRNRQSAVTTTEKAYRGSATKRRARNDQVLAFAERERRRDPDISDTQIISLFREKFPNHPILKNADPAGALRAARSRKNKKNGGT